MVFGFNPCRLNTLMKMRYVFGPFVQDFDIIIVVSFAKVVLFVAIDDVDVNKYCCYCYRAFICVYKHDFMHNLS